MRTGIMTVLTVMALTGLASSHVHQLEREPIRLDARVLEEPVGPASSTQPDTDAVRRALMDLEVRSHEQWRKGDRAALDALMSDDFHFVVMNGAIETKEEVVGTPGAAPQPGPLRVSSLRVEPERVLLRGDTAVVISLLHLEATVQSRPLPDRMRILSVFTTTADDPDWRLTARSITPILAPPPAGQAGSVDQH